MLFNSYVFLFLFLPLSLIGYYLFVHLEKGTAAKLVLTAASLIFYAYANPVYLLILLGSILFNYALCQGIVYERKRTGGRRAFCNALLVAGIAGNLGLLFYFKYYDFFVENLNAVFRTSFVLKGLILPLGISFFTFQQIGYVVDVWKGEAKVCSFLDYMLFVSYFPKLTQGPITVHEELLPQLAGIGKTRFSSERFTAGIYLFTMGMVKKVLVADTFGKAADWGYSNVCWLHWDGVHRLYFAHLGCVLVQSICWQRKIMERVHQFVLADASKRDIMREIFCVSFHHSDGGTEVMGDGGAEFAPFLHHGPSLLITF